MVKRCLGAPPPVPELLDLELSEPRFVAERTERERFLGESVIEGVLWVWLVL